MRVLNLIRARSRPSVEHLNQFRILGLAMSRRFDEAHVLHLMSQKVRRIRFFSWHKRSTACRVRVETQRLWTRDAATAS
jgi:hypothetical protein